MNCILRLEAATALSPTLRQSLIDAVFASGTVVPARIHRSNGDLTRTLANVHPNAEKNVNSLNFKRKNFRLSENHGSLREHEVGR